MANSYSAPNFQIDTDIDLAGLIALKGPGLASTDNIYYYNAAHVTMSLTGNLSLNFFYNGDNVAGNASVKTGYLNLTLNGYTLTLYDTTSQGGFNGKTGTGLGFNTVTGPGTVKANTTNVVSDYNIRALPNVYTNFTFDNFASVNLNTGAQCTGCTNINATGTYTFIFYTTPTVWANNEVANISSATARRIHFNYTATNAQFNYLLANHKVTRAAAGTNSCQWCLDERQESDFVRISRDTTAWGVAPTWNSTTGIQSLTAGTDGTLLASWNAATASHSQTVGYRVYIRAGAAPNSFGPSSVYFLAETRLTAKTICRDAAGGALDAAQTYYVIVCAVDQDGNEDTNTTALSVAPSTALLTGMNSLLQVILSQILQ